MTQSRTGDRVPGEGWTDVQVLDYLVTCFDRDTILDIVLGFAGQWFDRRLIGITGRRAIQAFSQIGWDELEPVPATDLKRKRAVLEQDAEVMNGPAKGRAEELGLTPLFDELGLDAATPVASIPIPISGRTAIVVVGTPPQKDLVALEVVCQSVGEQLETVIKMAKSDALPPSDQRVPPFPEPAGYSSAEEESSLSEASDRTEIGAPVPRMPGAFKERPQRRTLQSGEFDAPFVDDPSKPRLQRPPASSHTQQLDISESEDDNAPRLGSRTAESEADDAPPAESDASSTMFGLPVYPTNKSKEDDSAAEQASSSTMFGAPGNEGLDFARKKGEKSGVSVLPDREVGDETSDKRTLMGGIEASGHAMTPRSEDEEELLYDPSVFKSKEELEAERELEVDAPSANPNKMTMRGGFEVTAMADALREEMESASGDESSAAESSVSEVSEASHDELDDSRPLNLEEVVEPAPDDSTDNTSLPAAFKFDEESEAIEPEPIADEPIADESEAEKEAAEDSKSDPDEEDESDASEASDASAKKSSFPQAMILRPARKVRSTPQPRRDEEETAKPVTEREPEDPDVTEEAPVDYAVAPSSSAEDQDNISEFSEAAPSSLEESVPTGTAQGVGEVPVARPKSDAADDDKLSDAFDQYASRGELYESSSHTAIGGAWSSKQKVADPADDEPIDDAWLDYFSPEEDVAPEVMAPESEPRNRQAGPSTIPPEAIERIMDSGPHIVELQENFMMMDSRDKDRAFQAADDVATLGEEAIPVLELMFPGRLFIDRYQYTAETLPPISEHGPILAALVRIGEPSLYIARKFLDHGVIESRFYAVFLLTQLPAEELLGDLLERLFDRDVQTRTVARQIVKQYRRVGHFDSAILSPLRAELRPGNDDSRIEIASELLAEFRDIRAVEPLLAILGSYQGRSNQALHKSLQRITLKSWSSPYEWRHWWQSAKAQKRETWMVEALNSPSDAIRQMVYDEIQRLPGLELNYHPDQPAKLRERAQGQLIEWFAGRVGGNE